MKQTFTSKGTSINSTRVPALYHHVPIHAGDYILDYGCGRYDTGKAYAESRGATWFGYDTGWDRTPEDSFNPEQIDSVICSNVLNVIDSDMVVEELVRIFCLYSKHGTNVFVSVYEGDKSGEGRQTGKDSYQRNQRTKDYLPLFQAYDKSFVLRHGIITNAPEELI